MGEKYEKVIRIGEVHTSEGVLNRQELCNVAHKGGKRTYYTIWISHAFCSWMSQHVCEGEALGLALALTMRLTWEEVCRLNIGDFFQAHGTCIIKITYADGIPCYSMDREVCFGRMALVWLLERVSYLFTHGHSMGDILHYPVVGNRNNPAEAATADKLAEYAQGVIESFVEENIEQIYKLTAEKGAII